MPAQYPARALHDIGLQIEFSSILNLVIAIAMCLSSSNKNVSWGDDWIVVSRRTVLCRKQEFLSIAHMLLLTEKRNGRNGIPHRKNNAANSKFRLIEKFVSAISRK